MKKRYLIHYYDHAVESILSLIVNLDDKELSEYLDSLMAQGCTEIHYTYYPFDGEPTNPYINYPNIKPCPVCGEIPEIEYACGEYFINGKDGCRLCGEFSEMHASKDKEIDAWNKAADGEAQFECPLGGDETNDCADCAYGGDYHLVKGECVERNI